MRARGFLSIAFAAGIAGSLQAVEEPFCDPGAQPDICIDSVLSIRFVGTGTSEFPSCCPGEEIQAMLAIDVMDEGISHFSFGMKHDPSVLEVPQPLPGACPEDEWFNSSPSCNPTIFGTDLLGMRAHPWCGAHPCDGGIYAGCAYDFQKHEFPLGPNFSLAHITYRVIADPGPEGTKLSFTDELNPPGSPPVTVSLTTMGKSKRPRVVNNAMIYGGGAVPRFSRADANGDGKTGIADVVVIVENLFAARLVFFDCPDMLDVNDDGALNVSDPILLAAHLFQTDEFIWPPFGFCGIDPTPDALWCPQPNCSR
jgi:hypothetical protein